MSPRFDYADLLTMLVKALGLPAPVREFRPFPDRKWRIDCAWPDRLVAIEVDGGEWTAGRHSRGKGMQSDCEKANRLTLNGWSVFRLTGSQVNSGYGATLVEQILR
jgi:very-short-patch-repair endonuclease